MSYPKLVTNLFSPNIIWYQTDVTIVLRIMLHDLDKYYLRVECDHLLFSATLNEKHYCVCLYLFGTVVAEKTRHVNLGREIKITLFKAHKWTEWLRLHIEREKNPLIFTDPDHLYKNDWTTRFLRIEKENFREYMRRNNISQLMPDVPSSAEEESDDEEMDKLFW